MNIQLSEEDKIKVLNGDHLYSVMQKIFLREQLIDRNREHFWVIGLENNNRILFIELVSLGSFKSVTVEPMEVFSFALQKRAAKVILCHNHPTGDLIPSKEDKDVTDRLIQTGLIVNTPVLDHLIISEKTYFSFKVDGLMDELLLSLKYVPPYKIKEKMEKMAKQLKNKEQKIAIEALKKGLDVDLIAQITGLDIEKIELLKNKH
ncbi:MAG: JAB domain-containing protein [Flavobacteriales bacterium]|jgi:DNA repair protein RadC|nr:JAB domain-containing protein [Flavobacteriales bacterium]